MNTNKEVSEQEAVDIMIKNSFEGIRRIEMTICVKCGEVLKENLYEIDEEAYCEECFWKRLKLNTLFYNASISPSKENKDDN